MNISPFFRKPHFYETDQMGIVHHSNYIRWFEEARVHFMEQIGFPYAKINEVGIDFAVLSVSCEYLSMLRFGDTFYVEISLTQVTPSRMSLRYRVCNPENGEVYSVGESRHCYYSNHSKRPVSLQKALPELYHLFQELAQAKENPHNKN